jgi:dTDP-4-amino-4,6-dideoxygalactose transaminase
MGIQVFKPTIKRREMDHVLSCMISDRIGPGFMSNQLASEMSTYLEIAGGLCCIDYFTTLSLSLDIMDLKRGDTVIISALSPSIYLDVFREKGIHPLVVDVDPDSGTLLVEDAEKQLSRGPKAILLHYTLGFIPDLEALCELGIPIVEDLSQGLGGNLGTRRCGTFGDLVVVSFGPDNIITCAGGGAVLARERKKARSLKAYPLAGYHRLSDFNASLGIAQMKQIESFIAVRKEIAQNYSRSLIQSKHKSLVQKGEGENIYYSFPVLLDKDIKEAGLYARRKNVETKPAFTDSVIFKADGGYPNARNIALRCLLFPLYPMLGRKNIGNIARILSTLP